MKKSHKIALISFILIMAGVVGYSIFQKSAVNDPYIAHGKECSYINYVCSPGTTEFYDGVGCGCKAVEPKPVTPGDSDKKYIGYGKAECMAIDYVCEPGTGHFDDDIGCGCKAIVNNLINPSSTDEYYVGRGDECTLLEYACEPGKEAFYDNVGCGCK